MALQLGAPVLIAAGAVWTEFATEGAGTKWLANLGNTASPEFAAKIQRNMEAGHLMLLSDDGKKVYDATTHEFFMVTIGGGSKREHLYKVKMDANGNPTSIKRTISGDGLWDAMQDIGSRDGSLLKPKDSIMGSTTNGDANDELAMNVESFKAEFAIMKREADKLQAKRQEKFNEFLKDFNPSRVDSRLQDPAKRANIMADVNKFFEITKIVPITPQGQRLTDEQKFYGFFRYITANSTGLLTPYEIDKFNEGVPPGRMGFVQKYNEMFPGANIQANASAMQAIQQPALQPLVQQPPGAVQPGGGVVPPPTVGDSASHMPAFVQKFMNWIENAGPWGKIIGGTIAMVATSVLGPLVSMVPKVGPMVAGIGKIGGMGIIAQGAGELFGYDLGGMVKGFFTEPAAPVRPTAPVVTAPVLAAAPAAAPAVVSPAPTTVIPTPTFAPATPPRTTTSVTPDAQTRALQATQPQVVSVEPKQPEPNLDAAAAAALQLQQTKSTTQATAQAQVASAEQKHREVELETAVALQQQVQQQAKATVQATAQTQVASVEQKHREADLDLAVIQQRQQAKAMQERDVSVVSASTTGNLRSPLKNRTPKAPETDLVLPS